MKPSQVFYYTLFAAFIENALYIYIIFFRILRKLTRTYIYTYKRCMTYICIKGALLTRTLSCFMNYTLYTNLKRFVADLGAAWPRRWRGYEVYIHISYQIIWLRLSPFLYIWFCVAVSYIPRSINNVLYSEIYMGEA